MTRHSLISSVLLLAAIAASGDSPEVRKVEPPNWWADHSWNPVRVLVEGRALTGAQVLATDGLTADRLKVSDNGCWAMFDLSISPSAQPGARSLVLKTPGGSASLPFEVLPRPETNDCFQGFSPDDTIYLAMPDRFADGSPENNDPPASPGLFDRSKPRHYHGGDLSGVIKQLPYLTDLGVTALWLTPWYDNVNHLNQLEKYSSDNQRTAKGTPSTDYHGYGAVDFYGVEERFGDLTTLRQLVKSAHARGVRLIQDQVANHTGPYHRWTTNSPSPTWYNGTVSNHLENTWQTWTIADPNPPADKLRATLDGWFINILPDLNQDNPETAAYLIQNSLWWLGQTGIDAVRQDTLPYVPRAYWSRWTAALKREYPHLTVLGEMWDGNPKLVAFFQGGRKAFDGVDSGIDTLFDFPLCYAIRDVFAKRQPMSRLTDTLAADTNYVNPRVLVTFLGLHDMPRFLNEQGADITSLKLAFSFLLTVRGTPLIYYGDEVAMRGGGDPDNRRDFPGGFPGDQQSAFTRDGRTPEQASVHDHVRQLLALRRELAPLRRGDLKVLHTAPEAWACVRQSGDAKVLVLFNNGAQPLELALSVAAMGLNQGQVLQERFPGTTRTVPVGGQLRFRVPPRSAEIWSAAASNR